MFCSLVVFALSGSQDRVMAVCCLVENPSGVLPGRCGHWGFQVKCVPRYWELNIKNGLGKGIGKGC